MADDIEPLNLRLRVTDEESIRELLAYPTGSQRNEVALNALRLGLLRNRRPISSAQKSSRQTPAEALTGEALARYSTASDLARPLCEWLAARISNPRVTWPYHPRSNDLSDFVRRQVVVDLLKCCPQLEADARDGRVVCDLNVRLIGKTAQTRKLDLVIGSPTTKRLAPCESNSPLRKAKVSAPYMSIEVKACMTEHGKAIPRLVSELQQSIEVVKTTNSSALALAIVIVNVGTRFTSPLNRPGPNLHSQPAAARKVLSALMKRVVLGQKGYDALAIVTIDFDNETSAEPVSSASWVAPSQRYPNALGKIASAYSSASTWGIA